MFLTPPIKMPLPFVQPDSGLLPSDEWKEPVPLQDILGNTSFFSTSGRIYRLFGNEEKMYSMPEIPAVPPVLAIPKLPVLTLEEALQQIETFATPTTNVSIAKSDSITEQPAPNLTVRTAESVCTVANPPTLQLFQALGVPAVPGRQADTGVPLRLVNNENTSSNATISVKDIIRDTPQLLPTIAPARSPKPTVEKRKPLRVVSDHGEEPFIVPFAKPEVPLKEMETKNVALRVVTELIPPSRIHNSRHFSNVLKKYGQHRRKEKTLYRKRFSLQTVSAMRTKTLRTVGDPKPPIDASTFQWSAQLDSLMQTAGNQIRMLTDHLAVQVNQGIKAICFKSVFPGDGCSTILLCAVKALLEREYRILLIDSHYRHIDLSKQLNLSGNLETGREVITMNNRFGLWVWQESKTTEENITLLAEIVTTHREEYDLILLDDGSVTESPLTEFVAFWNRVELCGVVLVSNTKRLTETPVSHIAGRLRQHHIPLIGIAENYV